MAIFSGGMQAADLVLLEFFGEPHEVQGKSIIAVADEDEYRYRQSRRQDQPAEGVILRGCVLFCKFSDLDFRPESGDLMSLDGEEWIVASCELGEALLTVTLEMNHS